MWSLARQQRSRVFLQCSQLSRIALRQNHAPTAIKPKKIVPPTIKYPQKTIAETEITTPSLKVIESPYRLPTINIGDYVEAFRYSI